MQTVMLIARSQLFVKYRMITNDVNDYIYLLVRIAHIICNHSILNELLPLVCNACIRGVDVTIFYKSFIHINGVTEFKA
jgi:hypothetical protein